MPKLDPKAVVRRIKENDSLLKILIQIEDFLDSLDLYAFKNWIEGEIVAGPNVGRYWISIVLKYPYNLMPDPRGGMRMVNRDVRVHFRTSFELVPLPMNEPTDYPDAYPQVEWQPRLDRSRIWLITLDIPRRFIDDIQDVLDDEDESDLQAAEALSSPEAGEEAPPPDAAAAPEAAAPAPTGGAF